MTKSLRLFLKRVMENSNVMPREDVVLINSLIANSMLEHAVKKLRSGQVNVKETEPIFL